MAPRCEGGRFIRGENKKMSSRFWSAAAGVCGAVGVALGAFHAHGLEKRLIAMGFDQLSQRQEWFGTAVRYLMIHSVALMCVAIFLRVQRSRLANVAGGMFLLGMLLFSGSLIGLCFDWGRWLGMVAPLGGGSMILGWLALGCAGCLAQESQG